MTAAYVRIMLGVLDLGLMSSAVGMVSGSTVRRLALSLVMASLAFWATVAVWNLAVAR